MNVFKKILALIRKDSKYENESRRILVMLRWFYLVFLCYLLFFQLLMFLGESHSFSWIGAVSMVVVCVSLMCTYYYRIKTNLLINAVIQLVWIVSSVYLYGWDSGVQHFLFALMALVYFSLYDRLSVKIVITVLLFLLRLGMYFFCKVHAPVVTLSSQFVMILQVCNSLFLFLQLGILFGTFSSNIESAEKKLVEYNKRLEQQASTDPLTGLWNRRTMLNCIRQFQEENPEALYVVAMGDIDHFKRFNDQYGHDCGDAVLVWLAKMFHDVLRGRGKYCRWGGEEFVFFFPFMNGDEANAIISELWVDVNRTAFVWNDVSEHITMTFGLEESDYRSDLDSLIKKVDEKLYIGKERGRNRIIY